MGRHYFLAASIVFCALTAWTQGHAADPKPNTAKGSAAAGQKADMDAAAKIYLKTCRACHGNKAQGASSYPRLSDKTPNYIAGKLKRYRAGEKFGPNSVLMIQHAKKLSDQDITNLSVYVTTAFK